MDWLVLMHLGDLALTAPAAAAIAAWLAVAGAWRASLWWTALYGLAIALVGASKIAFLGWGTGLPAVGFKAISGHATGATAVLPMLLFLLFRGAGTAVQRTALPAGLGLGSLVACALVLGGEHTPAEALAGWTLGAAASAGTVCVARDLPRTRPAHGLAGAALTFALAALLMQWLPVGYLMAKAALALSGADRLHAWDTCG